MLETLLYSVLVFAGVLLLLAGALILAERRLVNYGPCHIDINAGKRPIDVDGGQTLLSALIGEQIYIPSACGGKGSCGYCKVVVTSGGGRILPTETPYLTRPQLRRGLRLACQVKVREDMQIRIPDDVLNVMLFHATVTGVRALTADIKEIRMTLNEPAEISYRPGQYVQIETPSPDGPVFRAYSISSPHYERREIELNVRLIPDGLASTYLHTLTEGDPIAFTGPYGDWRMTEDEDVELICVAGGVGLAPMKNIIYSFLRRWPQRTCRLFFGCRTAEDIYYRTEFDRLASTHPHFHVTYAISDPPAPGEAWDGHTGFIHLTVDTVLTRGAKRQAFICGPPEMIEAVTQVLYSKGLSEHDVFSDTF